MKRNYDYILIDCSPSLGMLNLQISGILITMVEGRSNFSKEIGQLVRQAYGRSIYSFDPKSKVALAYEQFTKEVLQNEKQRKNIQIASYDDLFKTDEEWSADTQERIQELPLDKLLPFPNHPFKVVDDEKMQDTVDSIKEYGVLIPILVRPKDDGNYEIVSCHHRHHASILASKTEILAIVREMDDDAAILVMVDSNLQREPYYARHAGC